MRSKNYKAALLKAQMGGGRLAKAQIQTNLDGFSKSQSSCPTCPNYVNPEDVIRSNGINEGPPPSYGFSKASLPCNGMECPESTMLDPQTCQCVAIPAAPGPGFKETFMRRGGQYNPNMNTALKAFKKGGSTKK